jgi:transposase
MNQVPFSTNTGARAAQEIQGPPADADNRAGANALDGFDPRALDYPGPMAGRRRRFTNEEKRKFLDEAAAAGESMSSIGRRYGLSVSLLFRWRRQLEGSARPNPRTSEEGARAEARELREKVREFERLLGRKTLEVELLKQELTRLGQNPAAALSALDNQR